MTKAQILAIVNGFNLTEYNLLCDNGVKVRSTKEYPVGYYTENGAEFAVQLRANSLQQDSSHSVNGKIEHHFTVLNVPAEHIQYLEFNPVKSEAPAILNYLKQKGAFTEEQAKMILNNNELYGIRVKK